MEINKNPVARFDSYGEYEDFCDFCYTVAELITKMFTTGYVKCTAKDMGWRHLNGYKVFEFKETPIEYDSVVDKVQSFMGNFLPNCCDWTCIVYKLHNGKGLYFNVKHHDTPVNGDQYYCTPITERTYNKLS